MGRIDAIISDPLETQLRMEVVRRFGGKKGDLQKAIEEAIGMWVNSDVMEKLKQKAMKEGLTVTEIGAIVDTLKQYGKPASHYLSDLLKKEKLRVPETKKIAEAIRQIQGQGKNPRNDSVHA